MMLIGWVWFYFTDLKSALKALATMFGLYDRDLYNLELQIYFKENLLLFVVAIIASTPLMKWLFTQLADSNPKLGVGLRGVGVPLLNITILIVATILLIGSTYNPFLYYRF
jgi:alginate O-acetyltransferase complex protein AlgI